jgi:hypothetical protein
VAIIASNSDRAIRRQCRYRLLASVSQVGHQTPGMDEQQQSFAGPPGFRIKGTSGSPAAELRAFLGGA